VSELVAARQEMGQPVSLDGELPAGAPVRIEPMALRRILANLVDNAVRYGRAARVAVAVEGDAAAVSVDDDGPGIPEGDLARVTAPFERLEPSRARASGGAGLGLAIAQALVVGHGGTLVLANRPEGGLRATVRLLRANG
jgi:two-component system, OmpR family, osmolarity sensor histidine kinase EnvZ